MSTRHFWQHSPVGSSHKILLRLVSCAVLSATNCWAQLTGTLTSEIAPQPLAQALAAFARQTSVQLIYISALANDRVSKGAPAGLPAAEALTRLLDGTGLSFELLTSRTVRLLRIEQDTDLPHPAGKHPQEAGAHTLGEIVVTATKREQRLSVVPISASILTQEQMDNIGVGDISEVAELTPGVEYDFSTQYGAGILTNLAIRGINSNVGAATTGVFIDDAPIQARNSNFGNPYPMTFDLERVEVLRGPQGTLFGAGAEGGAVRFITKDPSVTQSDGLYRAEYSSTEAGGPSVEAGAAAGGPLIDGSLGARASVWYRDEGGYVNRVNPFTGAIVDENANRTSTVAIRLGMAVEPSDSLRVTPSLAYQSVRTHDSPSFYTYLSNPGDDVFDNGKLLRQPAEDSFVVSSLKVATPIGTTDLTAVTSYFYRTASAIVDSTNVAGAVFFAGFGNPLGSAYPTSYADAIPTAIAQRQNVLSQEVRLTSSDGAAPLTWLAGLFLSRARQDDPRYTYAIATPETPGIETEDYNTDSVVAGFGNLNLALHPWTMSLGLRIERTRSDFTEHAGGYAYVGVPPVSHGVTDETPLTPRFGVSYQANESTFLYASLAKGIRIGGINAGDPVQCGASRSPTSYASDSVWSHEIGAKETFFDRRLRLDASAFYINWRDVQVDIVFECGFGYTANAGAARSKGFDLSADALLSDRLAAGVALSFIDVRYTTTVTANDAIIVDRGSVVGGVPSVPSPWNLMTSADYSVPIGGSAVAHARAEWVVHSHNPGPFTEGDPRSISYDPALRADPATSKVNLQLSVVQPRCDVKFSISNALNSHPSLQRFPDAPGSSLYYAYTFRPRTLSLTATRHF